MQVLAHAVLIGGLTVLGEGLTHDGDEHVQQVDTEGEGGKQEEQPEHWPLRRSTHSEIVVIYAKFTEGHQIDVLEGALHGVVLGIRTTGGNIKLYLILTNQVKSVGARTYGNEHGHNEVCNVPEDLEDDEDQSSQGVDELHEVEALGPNENGHEGLNDAQVTSSFSLLV